MKEHQSGAEGLGGIGEDSKKGRVGLQSGGNGIHGGGIGSALICIIVTGQSREMEITVEGTHTGFLIQITRKWERHKVDWTWSTPIADEVREAAGTQSKTT